MVCFVPLHAILGSIPGPFQFARVARKEATRTSYRIYCTLVHLGVVRRLCGTICSLPDKRTSRFVSATPDTCGEQFDQKTWIKFFLTMATRIVRRCQLMASDLTCGEAFRPRRIAKRRLRLPMFRH